MLKFSKRKKIKVIFLNEKSQVLVIITYLHFFSLTFFLWLFDFLRSHIQWLQVVRCEQQLKKGKTKEKRKKRKSCSDFWCCHKNNIGFLFLHIFFSFLINYWFYFIFISFINYNVKVKTWITYWFYWFWFSLGQKITLNQLLKKIFWDDYQEHFSLHSRTAGSGKVSS